MPSSSAPSRALSFADRAELPSVPPLASYLLTLISIKRSNLALSADVHTTHELLELAEAVGDYICVLKTHADIVDDFSRRTIRGLQDISKRKHFLIFEDRKFGDIGNTLQSQYTRGPFRIAQWAHIVNAHLLPGPSIVSSLHDAANETLRSLNQGVATTITSGTSNIDLNSANEDDSVQSPADGPASPDNDESLLLTHYRTNSNTAATATATTTISQTYEPSTPPARPPPGLMKSLSNPIVEEEDDFDMPSALAELGPPPQARGLLLLAQMSSEGNLAGKEYTKACVEAAREHKDFVLGFICQENLNTDSKDAFFSFAPGVGLAEKGDGKGQTWRTPEEVIGMDGIDVIIVGRGILKAEDRVKEAERYRRAAWAAYEARLKQ